MSGMAAARAEAEQALRQKRIRQQGGGAARVGSANMQAPGDLSAIEQFQAQKEAARARTNALGQTETGVPMWKVKAEAKRQMYLQSTEAAPKMRLVGVLLAKHKKSCPGCPSCTETAAAPDSSTAQAARHKRRSTHTEDASDSENKRRRKERKKEKKRKKNKKRKKDKRHKRKRAHSSSDSSSDYS